MYLDVVSPAAENFRTPFMSWLVRGAAGTAATGGGTPPAPELAELTVDDPEPKNKKEENIAN